MKKEDMDPKEISEITEKVLEACKGANRNDFLAIMANAFEAFGDEFKELFEGIEQEFIEIASDLEIRMN